MTDYLRTRLRLASADFITISEPMREVCAEADAALQAHAAEIARLTQSLDDREASLIRMREMRNQSLAEIARLQADGIHSCHADCTRSGCVNARLRAFHNFFQEKGEMLFAYFGMDAIDLFNKSSNGGPALESLRAWNDETDPDVASALDDLTKSRGTT